MAAIRSPHSRPRRTPHPSPLLVLGLGAWFLVGCAEPEPDPEGDPDPEEAAGEPAETESAVDAYWANLSAHCGQAFPGSLTLEPEGDDMLEGEELLVVHFDVCEEDEIRLPFHIEQMDGEWDRSRTWIFRPTDEGGIELRHDHRLPDGSEDEVTWYGGYTVAEGEPTVQEFMVEEQYEAEEVDGPLVGWRVIIEPGERYVYGTVRGEEWTWRVDFDLSEPMDEVPPPAWGYEDGGGPPR